LVAWITTGLTLLILIAGDFVGESAIAALSGVGAAAYYALSRTGRAPTGLALALTTGIRAILAAVVIVFFPAAMATPTIVIMVTLVLSVLTVHATIIVLAYARKISLSIKPGPVAGLLFAPVTMPALAAGSAGLILAFVFLVVAAQRVVLRPAAVVTPRGPVSTITPLVPFSIGSVALARTMRAPPTVTSLSAEQVILAPAGVRPSRITLPSLIIVTH